MTTSGPNPLARVQLFRGVALDALNALLTRSVARSYEPGEVLLSEGQPGTSMHVILRGKVRVQRVPEGLTQPYELARLATGDVIGEIGLLDGLPRTATVVALDTTETIEIDGEALAETMMEFPSAAVALLRTVSTRLRKADDLTAWYASRAPEHPDAED